MISGLNFNNLNIDKGMEGLRMSFIAGMLASVASFVASLGSAACVVVIIDEPECPESLIK